MAPLDKSSGQSRSAREAQISYIAESTLSVIAS